MDGQIEKFDRNFRFVDGVKYPLTLVIGEIPESEEQLKELGVYKVGGGYHYGGPRSVEDFNREIVRNNLNGAYMTSRKLYRGDRSYVRQMNMSNGAFSRLLKRISNEFGGRALSVLDAGCGEGVAYRELMKIEEIDESSSTGLTLPHFAFRNGLTPDLLYANIMHCAQKKRFDLLFDIHGAFTYHPTNQYRQLHTGMLSFLQAISLTEVGGIMFFQPSLALSIEVFEERGVLERIPGTGACRVLRHPRVDELIELTHVKAAA